MRFSSLRNILDGFVNKVEQRLRARDEIVNFNAYTRKRLVEEWAAGLAVGSKVLDAGAGECQYKALFSHCEYFSQDFCEYGGSESGVSAERWSYGTIDYVCDITEIPVSSACFDAIICTEVLEHLPEPISAIKEFSRLLKPGGRLCLTAPLSAGLHQEPHHYYGGFTPHFYTKFLTQYDFEVLSITPIGGLMSNVSQELIRVVRVAESKGKKIPMPIRLILAGWLPRYLYRFDKECWTPEFTVGYIVDAIKR